MAQVAPVVAMWWGYLDANTTIVGAVVAIVGAAAIAYLVRRVRRGPA